MRPHQPVSHIVEFEPGKPLEKLFQQETESLHVVWLHVINIAGLVPCVHDTPRLSVIQSNAALGHQEWSGKCWQRAEVLLIWWWLGCQTGSTELP